MQYISISKALIWSEFKNGILSAQITAIPEGEIRTATAAGMNSAGSKILQIGLTYSKEMYWKPYTPSAPPPVPNPSGPFELRGFDETGTPTGDVWRKQ